jgi:histidine triad (HIT) family protein
VTSGQCTFCRIAAGELGAHVIFEDADFLAFLDHRPLFAGHCLLVPRQHRETVLDLPPELGGALFAHVQRHVHVVPRRKKDGLKGFFWPRYKYQGEEEMIRTREAIVAALESA